MRGRYLIAAVAFSALAAGRCGSRDAGAAAPSPRPACAERSGPQCLPRAGCGCFGGQCVRGRIEPASGGPDRFVVDGGAEPAETGVVVEVCPNEANGLAACVTYVELAVSCTVTCSAPPELFEDPGYRCGFVGGECTVLPSGPSGTGSGGPGSGEAPVGPALDPSVGEVDRAAYAGVRDAAEWGNPYLIVRVDGVEIRSAGESGVVAADGVAAALAALPATAWPYGRVVAVQEQSIRAGDGSDDERIRRNKEACEAELERLGVVAEWWPSA